MSRPVPTTGPPSPPCRNRSAWPVYGPHSISRHARFAVDRRAPAASREFARVALSASGRAFPRPVIDDVMIVVAELVTDSYLGNAGSVEVGIDVGHEAITVSVRDDRGEAAHGGCPAPPRRNETREMLLDALTVGRSTFTDGGGTVHVARVPVPVG